MFDRLATRAHRAAIRLRTAWGDLHEEERGDIPGWVLVTLMTAAIVVAVWALAGPALTGLFQQAMDRVTGM
ncbi:hypothetical protein [Microbacterium karelineae]|uniref:hypothetical protein n=1 Tax=Microbacterium karelineae TaxID=2654283 RepID=UPI0012EAD581|nr:hypothetical protein [Microbacterium karelineae]